MTHPDSRSVRALRRLAELKRDFRSLSALFLGVAAGMLLAVTQCGCTAQQGRAAGAAVPVIIDSAVELWRAMRESELFACGGDADCETRVREKWSPACESQGGCEDNAPVIAGPQE